MNAQHAGRHLRIVEAAHPTTVCAWCRTTMHAGGPRVTHGICRGCAARVLSELEGLPPAA